MFKSIAAKFASSSAAIANPQIWRGNMFRSSRERPAAVHSSGSRAGTLTRMLRLPSRLVLLSTLAVVGVGCSMITTAAAQAGVQQWSDGFEGSAPWTSWYAWALGNASAGYDINKGFAHTGQNNGWLWVGTQGGEAGERIHLSLGTFPYRNQCSAGVYATPIWLYPPSNLVELQVTTPNGRGGFNLIARQDAYLNAWFGYQAVVINNLNLSGYGGILYLQAIYRNLAGGAAQYVRLDDMTFSCSTPY
jgi:hypothetical protein